MRHTCPVINRREGQQGWARLPLDGKQWPKVSCCRGSHFSQEVPCCVGWNKLQRLLSHEATRWQGRAVSRGMSSLPTHCHHSPKGLLTQHLQYLWPHPLERVHEPEIRDFSILYIHPLLRLVRNFLSLWGQEVNKLCILLIKNVIHISTFPCTFCLNVSIRPVITKPSKVSAPPHPFTPHSY